MIGPADIATAKHLLKHLMTPKNVFHEFPNNEAFVLNKHHRGNATAFEVGWLCYLSIRFQHFDEWMFIAADEFTLSGGPMLQSRSFATRSIAEIIRKAIERKHLN